MAPLADELYSGVPTLGAPDIRAGFDLGYGALAAVVLSLPLLAGLLVEAPLLLLSTRVGRRRMAVGGFLTMSLAALAAACSVDAWQLGACLSVAAIAGGVALALAQASLMDGDPERREVWMTRWALGGSLGDLLAPGMFALLAAVGLGWRAAFVVVALFTLSAALGVWRAPVPPAPDDDEHVPLKAALRRALQNRALLAWCAGVALCDLLDEIVIVIGTLFLREVRGADAATAALAIALFSGGSAVGLIISERLLARTSPARLLAFACVLCAAALIALLALPHLGASVALLGCVGFFAAPLYPLATAQMYRALPEDSTMVAAIDRLFEPARVALPVIIAFAADRFGLGFAMGLLLMQPLGLLSLALRWSGRSSITPERP